MNYIYVYDSQNQQKYKFSSFKMEDTDGVIRVANAYFAFDDTGAELESGSSEFVVESNGNKLVFASNDYFDVYQSENIIGRFYVQNALKESMTAWRVQGIDILGKAENKTITKSYADNVSLSQYLLELYSTIGEQPTFTNETDNVIIELAESQQTTLRELSQKLALGVGATFTTKSSKYIKISLNPDVKYIDRNYSINDVYDSAVVSDKDKFNGTIRVYKTYVSSTSSGATYSYGIDGYVPVGQDLIITPYYNPVLDVKMSVNGVMYEPYNGFYLHSADNIMLATVGDWNVQLKKNRRTSEYTTVSKTFDNFIKYSIDEAALDDVYADAKEGLYIDEQGNKYAYINLYVQVASVSQKEIGAVTMGNEISGEENELILPCADINTLNRIRKSFRRTREIQFGWLYKGEQLGEIVKVPNIWESGEYAVIKKISLDFSANNIFAEITADILSDEEIECIRYDGAEYGDDTEYGDGTEYGGYEIYEEVQ